jgi:hypothetical protein
MNLMAKTPRRLKQSFSRVEPVMGLGPDQSSNRLRFGYW